MLSEVAFLLSRASQLIRGVGRTVGRELWMKSRAGVLLLLFLPAGGCPGLGEPSRDEVVRITSPSQSHDAVVIETNGGATTSFGYEVHVVPRGQQPSSSSEAAFLYGAVRNDDGYGVNLHWRGDDMVVVEYLSARQITQHTADLEVAARRIRVFLVSGVRDDKAPPGGMANITASERR
jgi:hypothetical protein